MCERLEDIACDKIYYFLNEFCPYEADEVIYDWREALQENPMQVMEWVEEYNSDVGYDDRLKPLYDDMYDAVYEVCMCYE